MTSRILWKLLAINIPVLIVAMAVVWMAIDHFAADYFMNLMKKYHIEPVETHRMFIESVHQYLIQASLVALGVAAILSYGLTKKVLRPLSEMADVTRKIAQGDYSARVTITSKDEIGELGGGFNQMADSLERIEQLRRSMVVDIAHEFRTPMTNIRGYLEGMEEGVVTPTKDVLLMLKDESLRLVRLIEDLQQLTHADAAKGYLNRQDVFLPDLLTRVLEVYRSQFDERDITVNILVKEGVGSLMADPDRLLQAVGNLLQNACRYTPQGGKVRVTAERLNDGIRVMVANTGKGISSDDLPFIFERFYRGDKSRSRDSGGTGIGLAIVKGIIEAHGGQVGAKSQDSRTWVWFLLPA